MVRYSIKLSRTQIEYLLGESFTEELTMASDKLRKLYGIISIEEYYRKALSHNRYRFFNLSAENKRLVEEAMENSGWFTKTFPEKDTEVLRYVYEKNKELREKYGENWNPRFGEAEISKNKKGADPLKIKRLFSIAYNHVSQPFRATHQSWVLPQENLA